MHRGYDGALTIRQQNRQTIRCHNRQRNSGLARPAGICLGGRGRDSVYLHDGIAVNLIEPGNRYTIRKCIEKLRPICADRDGIVADVSAKIHRAVGPAAAAASASGVGNQ
jgi:hypothetical protein